MKLPILDGVVNITTDTPSATDPFVNGIAIKADNSAVFATTTPDGTVTISGGLARNSNGALIYRDATGSVPSGMTYAGGLPVDSAGALCTSTDAVVSWSNGLPFDALGLLGRGGGAPLPAPTTVQYTAAQVAAGMLGAIDTARNAARIYGSGGNTGWVGIITGTEAKLTATSEWGNSATLIEVSVDGGAFAIAPNTGSVWTLFTGLPHGPHLVVWRFGLGFSDKPYIASSGNVLQVTGRPPSIYAAVDAVKHGIATSVAVLDAELSAPTGTYISSTVYGTSSNSNVASARVRGAIDKLYIGGNFDYVYVSKDGAAPSRYSVAAEANTPFRGRVLTGLGGGLATYNVWAKCNFSGGRMHVGADVPFVDIGSKRRLDQFGDSITFGAGCTSPGEVETMRVAAALGFTGSTCGISGYTIAQLDTLLTTVLPRRTITSNDVAVIAIGRNNVGGAFDAAETSGYQSIISKLLAAGYGTVLCRGILPAGDHGVTWPAENGSIQSIVAGLANPNVKFVDTSSYPTYTTASNDNTHPDDAGYTTLAPYVEASYRAALGL